MNQNDLNSIYELINNLEKPNQDIKKKSIKNNNLQEILINISQEIQRVLDENEFTQEELCKITEMSQSNLSKILNGKVVPRLETLQKIALATHTKLIISFESLEGDE